MSNPAVSRTESVDPREVEVAPRVDVYENDREYLVVADLPGVAPAGLAVGLDDHELSLDARRVAPVTVEGAEYLLRYRRSFRIPATVDAARIDAALAGGVLELRLPKSAAARPRRIDVRVS
ncbi:MAG: Hsp20/alpha crystallin family protein [Polyangiaceae bacterium]|nr:Hsp20/alpha crystallin family protein [Polyangiaceae bacterium]